MVTRKLFRIVSLLSFFGVFVFSSPAFAAGDFVLTPSKVELQIKPGEQKVVTLTVVNRTGKLQDFKIDTEDFVGTRDPLEPLALLGESEAPLTLKDFIRADADAIQLKDGESARILVRVSVPADAPPGSRHAALLLGATSPKFVSTLPTANATIVPRLGALFFVRVPGEVREEGGTTEFSVVDGAGLFQEGPVTFRSLYENTGTVYENPYGEIRINNMLGEEVGVVRMDPWYVLPGALRSREVTWGASGLLGRYTATLHMNRGYGNIIDERIITFWIIPWPVALIFLVALAMVFYVLRWIRRKISSR